MKTLYSYDGTFKVSSEMPLTAIDDFFHNEKVNTLKTFTCSEDDQADPTIKGNEYNLIPLTFQAKKDFDPDKFITDLHDNLPGCDFLMYLVKNGTYTVVFQIDRPLTEKTMTSKSNNGLSLVDDLKNVISNLNPDTVKVRRSFKPVIDLNAGSYIASSNEQQTYWKTTKDNQFDAWKLPNLDTDTESESNLVKRIKKYLNETLITFTYPNVLKRFLLSLKVALKSKKNALNQQGKDQILTHLQLLCKDHQDPKIREIGKTVFSQFDKLKTNVRSQDYVNLSKFYVLSPRERSQTLGKLLLTRSEITPSDEIEKDQIFNLLWHYFDWAIDATADDQIEGLLVFDPRNGYWVNANESNELVFLVNSVRHLSTRREVQDIADSLATKAYNNQQIIKPHHSSRYLLFANGVLDVKTLALLPLDSEYVKSLNFTERSRINLDWKGIDFACPELCSDTVKRAKDGGVWTPEMFISAYGENDPEKRRYFLFCLSLGLFSGHNFGVNVNFKGGSGWGKTTLFEIYRSLFKTTTQIVFSQINEQFPFTSYKQSNSVIWLKECNTGQNTLNSEYGTPLYDSLCDSVTHFQSKHNGDIIVENAPQVFVDGLSLIHADDLQTGPARRTLPYILSDVIDRIPENYYRDINGNPMTLRDQLYCSDINSALNNPDVLRYMVAQMVKAYRETIDLSMIENFKINLVNHNNHIKFPAIVDDWRKEFISSGNDLENWFSEAIKPNLFVDESKPTLLHDDMLYSLYRAWYAQKNKYDIRGTGAINEERFKRLLNDCWINNNFNTEPTGSYGKGKNGKNKYKAKHKKVSSFTSRALNFDCDEFIADNQLPAEYQDGNLGYPFNKNVAGWYNVTKVPDYSKI